MSAKVKFWGVRGSIPAPLTAADVQKKLAGALSRYSEQDLAISEFLANEAAHAPFTYGGNTSCVEVTCDGSRYIFDLGTGARPLGNSLFPQMIKDGGLKIVFVISHVHWDHIQGLPFFGPLHAKKHEGFENKWTFLGGTRWQKTAEACLAGQMDAPTFPVSWQEIEAMTYSMEFKDVHDGMSFQNIKDGPRIILGKLNHPQETYGSRMVLPDGKVIVYATDNEPHDPMEPDPRLLTLVKGSDLWIADCQYTKDQYNGKEGGVTRHGWGHSYPEALAATALQAEAKHLVLFHHDPASSDERITDVRAYTENLIRTYGGATKVTAAWEGLELSV